MKVQNLASLLILVLIQLTATAYAGAVEQATGSYNKGRLKNASQLKPSGPGYILLFPERDRAYGTEELVTTVETVAASMAQSFPDGERLQVGDLSARLGGYVSGHGSHQNGLDVDFSYFRMNHQEQDFDDVPGLELLNLLSGEIRFWGFDEEFVIEGKLSSNFDLQRNWEFFKMLVATTRINRMFVDPVIKASLCSYSQTQGDFNEETLRHLRPWPNHGDHSHVRLLCPEASKNCVPQAEIEPGSGCGEVQVLNSGDL